MRNTIYVILAILSVLPVKLFGLDMVRAPHPDPVFEAIHRGNRQVVLNSLRQGYNPNTKDNFGHTAVSYAAQCKRIQILRDLVENGGEVNYHAVRCSRRPMPIDIAFDYRGPAGSLGDTFAYLFWEECYFLYVLPLPIILIIIIGVIFLRWQKSKKKANQALKQTGRANATIEHL